jgi:hypothetical protein
LKFVDGDDLSYRGVISDSQNDVVRLALVGASTSYEFYMHLAAERHTQYQSLLELAAPLRRDSLAVKITLHSLAREGCFECFSTRNVGWFRKLCLVRPRT